VSIGPQPATLPFLGAPRLLLLSRKFQIKANIYLPNPACGGRIWHESPFRLVSVMELIRTHLPTYVAIGQLHSLSQLIALDEVKWVAMLAEDPPNHAIVQFREVVQRAGKEAQDTGMVLCVTQAQRVSDALATGSTTSAKDFLSLVKQLGDRFADYLNSRIAVMIPEVHKARYENPTNGWEAVIDKFPLTTDHIEEAGKCLALGRYTASVYHLSGVVQDALESLGKKLGVPLDPTSDTWNGLINKIDSAIRAKQTATPNKKSWKTIEPFYSEVTSDIKAIKNAWRNPTMHFRRTYTDAQAEKIYARVQEFMTHASTHLRGRKS
jgi:hypothetical protein